VHVSICPPSNLLYLLLYLDVGRGAFADVREGPAGMGQHLCIALRQELRSTHVHTYIHILLGMLGSYDNLIEHITSHAAIYEGNHRYNLI